MGESTSIEWCDHTFNPWRGCAKVSPGCAHCYAETLSQRFAHLGQWGVDARRDIASETMWREPERWNRALPMVGQVGRRRVFCASLADVFEDRPDLVEPRARLFRLIEATPDLTWMLLTKRPENFKLIGQGRDISTAALKRNVWLGVSVEDQRRADERLPWLITASGLVARTFVSYEPALGPVDFAPWVRDLDFIIVGGESGSGARLFDTAWARHVIDVTRGTGCAAFVKQLGLRYRNRDDVGEAIHVPKDRKGGDMAEWPSDLRVREMPS